MTFDSNELRQNAFHFEGDVYNKYRPTYPPELFSEIIKYAEHNFDKPRGGKKYSPSLIIQSVSMPHVEMVKLPKNWFNFMIL